MNQDSQTTERITLSEYYLKRNTLICEKVFGSIGISFFLILPFILIAETFSSPSFNSGAAFTVLIVAFCVGAFILYCLCSMVSERNRRQKQLKEDFLKTATAEERCLMEKYQKRGKIVRKALLIFSIIGGTAFYLQLSNQYKTAEQFISDEKYNEAVVVLESLPVSNFKDTQSLIGLCNAHLEYLDGDPLTAYQTLRFTSFSHQTEQQMEVISDFRTELINIKDEYDRQEERRKKEEYEQKLRNGKPFVGMPESRINDTVLGKPSSDVRHNTECISGEIYTANLYDWYSGGKIFFTARCVRGKVTQVWETPDKKSNTSSSYRPSTSSQSSSHTVSSDPSVEGYIDPEDFYDDYWDDFFDYEDAEDYYYSHDGK